MEFSLSQRISANSLSPLAIYPIMFHPPNFGELSATNASTLMTTVTQNAVRNDALTDL